MSTNSWEIPHSGGVRMLTIEPGQNGKEMIRLDGRPAAKPLDPSEDERDILIDGQLYILRRIPGGFGFDLEFPPPVYQSRHQMSAEAASAGMVGGFQAATETFKLGRLIWIVLAGVIFAMIYFAIPRYENEAVKRVNLLLKEMALGPGPQEELAMGIWLRNTRTPTREELSWCIDHFPEFRKAKDLRRKFTTYSVVKSEMVEGAKVPTALITIDVEGKQFKMLVPERKTITWAD